MVKKEISVLNHVRKIHQAKQILKRIWDLRAHELLQPMDWEEAVIAGRMVISPHWQRRGSFFFQACFAVSAVLPEETPLLEQLREGETETELDLEAVSSQVAACEFVFRSVSTWDSGCVSRQSKPVAAMVQRHLSKWVVALTRLATEIMAKK